MEIVYLIFFFILGLVFGSFYNVVGLRLGAGESLIKPRSHCTKCNHVLRFYELIPVISYVVLRGKCKKCKQKISIMYPLIELFTAVLFALSYYVYGFSFELILSIIICSLFVIIIVTDLNYYIIPDSIIVVFGLLIFIYNIITKGFLDACSYALFGFIMFLFMFALMKLGNALFKQESLGGGDIKLMGILGMIFKPLLSLASLTLAAFLALPCSLYLMFRHKDKVIPFGPFIVAGFIIIMLTGIDVKDILDFLVKY